MSARVSSDLRGRDHSQRAYAPGYGAEGATAPETLRQTDREGDDTLESERRVEAALHRRA